jgi:hypothetical protein
MVTAIIDGDDDDDDDDDDDGHITLRFSLWSTSWYFLRSSRLSLMLVERSNDALT